MLFLGYLQSVPLVFVVAPVFAVMGLVVAILWWRRDGGAVGVAVGLLVAVNVVLVSAVDRGFHDVGNESVWVSWALYEIPLVNGCLILICAGLSSVTRRKSSRSPVFSLAAAFFLCVVAVLVDWMVLMKLGMT